MPSKLRKTIAYFVGVLLVTALGLILILSRQKNDIRYKGVPLSRHLLNRYLPANAENGQKIADSHDAVAFAGTNALPLLAEWLDRRTPPWRVKVGTKLWKRGFASTLFPLKAEEVAAGDAVIDLKADGLSLSPRLAKLCSASNEVSNLAMGILIRQMINWRAEMPLALEHDLQKAIDDTLKELSTVPGGQTNWAANRIAVMQKLSSMLGRPEPSDFIVFSLRSIPPDRRDLALRRLSRRGLSYDDVKYFLLEDLRSTNASIAENAAICLRNYGAVASNSLPQLRQALSNPNLKVRTEASNAITRITALMADEH